MSCHTACPQSGERRLPFILSSCFDGGVNSVVANSQMLNNAAMERIDNILRDIHVYWCEGNDNPWKGIYFISSNNEDYLAAAFNTEAVPVDPLTKRIIIS